MGGSSRACAPPVGGTGKAARPSGEAGGAEVVPEPPPSILSVRDGWQKAPRGVVLGGPPGTGKPYQPGPQQTGSCRLPERVGPGPLGRTWAVGGAAVAEEQVLSSSLTKRVPRGEEAGPSSGPRARGQRQWGR